MNDTIKIYAVKDKKAGFTEVMEGVNDAIICRQIGIVVNDTEKKNLMAKFPADFEVWKLSEVDRETGETKADLRKIANCEDWVKAEK